MDRYWLITEVRYRRSTRLRWRKWEVEETIPAGENKRKAVKTLQAERALHSEWNSEAQQYRTRVARWEIVDV